MIINHTVTPADLGAKDEAALFDKLLAAGNREAAFALDPARYVADKRWRIETGGVMVGGAQIATDRQSQAMITGAHAFALSNPGTPIKFKSGGAFVTLDAPTMIAIAQAVAAHVQEAFATEADVLAGIASGEITTAAAVDAVVWPSNT